MSEELRRNSLIAVATMAFAALFSTVGSAEDRAFWEKRVPAQDNVVGGTNYVVIAFLSNGRKFSTGDKYHYVTVISRSQAINTAVKWGESGLLVHVLAITNKDMTEKYILEKIGESYEKRFKKLLKTRPTSMKLEPKSSSLVGTTWLGYDHGGAGSRFTLYLGAGGTAQFRYGRRTLRLRWTESNGTFSVEAIEAGQWMKGKVDSSRMTTTYSNGGRGWTLTRG